MYLSFRSGRSFGSRRLWTSVLAAAVVFTAAPGFAEDQPAPKDTIFARKVVMGDIDMNMDEIETMLAPEGKLLLSDAQEHAEVISTLLMAFPHLFPPSDRKSVV